MTRVLIIGLILGVATGLSPRPTLPLLVGEVVRFGLRAGLAGLAGVMLAKGLLAIALVALSLVLQQAAWITLIAAELLAALGLFYVTYQVGLTLPRVRMLAVEDVARKIRLGHWPGLAGIHRGSLVTLGSSFS